MTEYRDLVQQNALFSEYDKLADFEEISRSDIEVLKGLVLNVAEIAGPHLDRIRSTFVQYTEHDLRHVLNIAENIHKFLPKRATNETRPVVLNALELTYLWCAILLHDVGMFVSDAIEKQTILDSTPYQDFLHRMLDRQEAAEKAATAGMTVRAQAIRDAIFAEFIRRQHAERVRRYLAMHLQGKLSFRSADLSAEIAQLCESHAWGVGESHDPRQPYNCVKALATRKLIGRTPVNLAYLACCLRLGDILDFDRTRTPLSAFHDMHFTENLSIHEWNKHLSIEGVEITEHRVLYDAKCKHPADYVAVQQFLDWVDRELQHCVRLIHEFPANYHERYSLTLSPVVDRYNVRMADPRYVAGAFRFQLEYEQILHLLMDKSLYPDSAMFLRELLQNALDACRYQKALAEDAGMGDKYIPRIQVHDLSMLLQNPQKPDEGPRIIFRDNGVGMSQSQVENFFMRVGKSFYRSPEFQAERARLAAKGIQLEATSQFGIGFLSCFLGGDRIEVTTYRYGSQPLRITIEGPNKYFMIERLDPQNNVILYNSPSDPGQDRPPHYAGTSITVYLRDGWYESDDETKADLVFKTLEYFAVNQDVPITVIGPHAGEDTILPACRWNTSVPDFCEWKGGEGISHEYLIPATFALADMDTNLRGMGAIWMLNDRGKPIPCKGDIYLHQRRSFGLHYEVSIKVVNFIDVLYHFISGLAQITKAGAKQTIIEAFERVGDSEEGRVSLIQQLAYHGWPERTILYMLQDTLESLENYEWQWLSAISKDLINIRITDHSHYWYESAVQISALLTSDRDALIDALRYEGIPSHGIAGNPEFRSKIRCALFGIETPGGFQTWLPAEGKAQRHNWLPSGLSIHIDMWGRRAPQPAVSRLFIPDERSHTVRQAVTRAFLHHADALRKQHPNIPEWREWFRGFVDGWAVTELAAAVGDEEMRLIEDSLSTQCQADGTPMTLSPRELCQRFGSEVLVLDIGKHDSDYVRDRWWLPGYEERQKAKVRRPTTVDLTPLAQRLGL